MLLIEDHTYKIKLYTIWQNDQCHTEHGCKYNKCQQLNCRLAWVNYVSCMYNIFLCHNFIALKHWRFSMSSRDNDYYCLNKNQHSHTQTENHVITLLYSIIMHTHCLHWLMSTGLLFQNAIANHVNLGLVTWCQ